MTAEAEANIRHEISERGPITFARFMELALYGTGGYYTSGSPISAGGDYFTAPSAHPLFGALIAVQLQEMWSTLGSPKKFTVVEEAAGNGGLAADITEAAETLDAAFADALGYIALDIAPPERQHYPVSSLEKAPQRVTGCVLSNELFDAMPVHRFEVRGGQLLELFVGVEDDRLVEVLDTPSTPLLEQRLGDLLGDLPNGYRGEVNPALEGWAQRQAKTLERGWVLTIDYGFDRPTLYKAERTAGSLRTYSRHTLGQDPLAMPGRQDITAHVDFTALDEAMAAAGFGNAGSTTQSEFLSHLGLETALESLRTSALPRQVKRANIAGILAIADATAMGKTRVAVHSRGIPSAPLNGFNSSASRPPARLERCPLLRQGRHIDLTSAQQDNSSYFEVGSLDELFSGES